VYEEISGGEVCAGHGTFQNPPSKPIMLALKSSISLRQVTVGFQLKPRHEPNTISFLSGFVLPHVVCAIPETGCFKERCTSVCVQQAQDILEDIQLKFCRDDFIKKIGPKEKEAPKKKKKAPKRKAPKKKKKAPKRKAPKKKRKSEDFDVLESESESEADSDSDY
jgi:hypothetical protein